VRLLNQDDSYPAAGFGEWWITQSNSQRASNRFKPRKVFDRKQRDLFTTSIHDS
jgi:hypothetical protein